MIDLHTHSIYSDGTFTPGQLVAEAKRQGLEAIALTDHNTVQGLPEFLEAGKKEGVETVPGVEMSAQWEDIELHILGLFIPQSRYEDITARLNAFRERKENSNIELVSALAKAGMVLDYPKIRGDMKGYVNRAVIGSAMTEAGYTASVAEAFEKYLLPGRGFYTPPRREDALEIIAFLKSLGAVTVLAHPFLNLDTAALSRFLPMAVAAGLDGMEILYSEYDRQTTVLSGEIADAFSLLPSGGSDFHGANKPDIRLGKGKGNLKIPYRYLSGLRSKGIPERKEIR